MTVNYDPQTVEGFGKEWTKFDHSTVQESKLEQPFAWYFSIFPWPALPHNAVGFDMGCGSGRWAKLVAPRVGKLYCIDASADALAVARKNLELFPNVEFSQVSVEAMPLAPESMDFGYSLGVLHHVPDTLAGIKSCVGKLKPEAPFLLYLYYAFDNQPLWFRVLWKITNVVRRLISQCPFQLRYYLSQIIAALIYYPLARLARLAAKVVTNVNAFPLSFYRDLSFYSMRNDALDRFGTKLEKRFTRAQMKQMMEEAGLEQIIFSEAQPYWCAVGYKRNISQSHIGRVEILG